MDDLRIIELYFERDEQAIKETDAKYGKLCHSIAYNILNHHEDSEECVNDTYVGVWNAIPPTRPSNFMSFVCKIARNLSLKRLEFMKREKRSADVMLSLDELESVLSEGKGSRVYLVKDGVIVGAEDPKMLGRQEKALDSAKVNQKAIKNARSGWSILLCQSIREYQKAIEEQVIFWIMVVLAVLLIFVLLIYRVTKPVMISVNDIVDAMKNLEKDNFREKLEVKEKDSTEIQEISEGFNEMSERIHNLIGQVQESAMEQKNAEISALEAQIDPHFLYNILDTINWKAIENEQYEISEMLVALADILRYAINDAGEFTTIDAEKGWLEKYILLQQEKLGEEIELEFKIQDSYGKCKSHKMLLQPFVENAIKYSFRGYEGAHRLTIEVSKAEEQMHIIIANNGRHIEEDQLKEWQCYTVEDLFCCGYARYFWEAIKIRYPEYCFYKDWEDIYAEN